jgi:endonuclease III
VVLSPGPAPKLLISIRSPETTRDGRSNQHFPLSQLVDTKLSQSHRVPVTYSALQRLFVALMVLEGVRNQDNVHIKNVAI